MGITLASASAASLDDATAPDFAVFEASEGLIAALLRPPMGGLGQAVLMRRCRSRLPVPRSSFAGFRFRVSRTLKGACCR